MANDPQIYFIEPKEVSVNWTGTVKITGAGFDNDCIAMFNGKVPRSSFVSSGQLNAEVDKDITSQAGQQTVKVHRQSDGTLSNEVAFIVK